MRIRPKPRRAPSRSAITNEGRARLKALGFFKDAGLTPTESLLADEMFDFMLAVRDIVRQKKAERPDFDPVVMAVILIAEMKAELDATNLAPAFKVTLATQGALVIERELGIQED